MALQAGVGFSADSDAYTAGVRAAQQTILQLADAKPNLYIVFSTVAYNQEKMLSGVRSVTGDTPLVGASTAGEITTDGPMSHHGVVVMGISTSDITFETAVGSDIALDARAAGRQAAETVRMKLADKLKLFMMFPDVLVGNGAAIVRGALDALGEHFPVVGGAAGDDFKFEKTYQYSNDKVYSGAVIGVGLGGNFKFGIGVKHGWIPVGIPMKVTKAEGSVVHELDGKPAISIYEDYFGKDEALALRKEPLAKMAITYPLGMSVAGSDELLIRDPITVNDQGSITCAAEIPEGSEVRLMVGSREDAVRVAKIAAEDAMKGLDGGVPKAVIIFNCIARSKLFGEHSGEEISAIQEAVGKTVPLIGFYTYGEQAPLGGEVRNIEQCNSTFHNETVVILVLGE